MFLSGMALVVIKKEDNIIALSPLIFSNTIHKL